MPTRSYNVADLKPLIEHAAKQAKFAQDWPAGIESLAKLDPKDLRRHIFNQQAQLFYNLGISMVYFHDSLLHYAWWDAHGCSHLSREQKMQNAASYGDQVWLSTFLFLFQTTEGAIRRFHFALDPVAHGASTGDYYKVRGHLFQLLGLPDDPERTAFFSLISLLRNCVHNNGVYRSKKADQPRTSIAHRGKQYEFVDGFPPNCLGPEFLLQMMDEALRFFQKLVQHQKIWDIPFVENWYSRLGSHETEQG